MDAKTFVDAVGKLAPTLDELIRGGSSREGAVYFQRGFFAPPREPGKERSTGDPVLDLIANYDVSTLEIGRVTFLQEVEYSPGKYVIGKEEADPLVMDPETGEIRLEELGTDGFVIATCAASGGQFLDALYRAQVHFRERSRDESVYNDNRKCHEAAEECARLAGGARYLGFYQTFLGCE
jgi:hypothetical protein